MLNRRDRHGWRKCRGLTLTELIVSTAILAWMILVANQMLISSRNAIRAGEAAIRANAEARAVATRMRQDLEQACPDGVLLVMEIPPKNAGGVQIPRRSALSFTAVGSYRSRNNDPNTNAPVTGNLQRIDYGLSLLDPGQTWGHVDDNGTPGDPSDDKHFGILYRRAMVSRPGATDGTGKDFESVCLSWYRFLPRAPAMFLDQWVGSDSAIWWGSEHPEGGKPLAYMSNPIWESGLSPVPNISLPVSDLATLDNLWPYMLGDVSYLNFQWTDGSTDADGKLRWFDRDNPLNGNWLNIGAMREATKSEAVVEYARSNDPGGFTKAYCAFWSFKHRELWPKALKVQFKVGNPPRPYEIVVALPMTQ